MADNSVSSKQPNLRFGTSFLNTKYRNRAAEDEVLMDKSTGEIAFVRPGTKDFMYFTRENFQLENWLVYIHSIYESIRTEKYPTVLNCSEFKNTYLLGTQFDLEAFTYNTDSTGSEITNFADGAIIGNNSNTEYNISNEETGMFVELHARPRDVVLINMISKISDTYFENYSGSNAAYIEEKNRINGDSTYKGSSAEIHYTIRMYKGTTVSSISNKSGFCNINQPCYIPFNTAIPSRSDYQRVTLSIDYIGLPKLKFFANPLSKTSNEQALIDIVDDVSAIKLNSLDVFTFTTMSDSIYTMPNKDNALMLTLLNMNEFENAMSRISKLSKSDGIICSVKSPTDDEWSRISLWAELIRNVYIKGDTEDTGADSSFNDMDAFFGKADEISGPFVLNSSDNGYLVEKIGTATYTIDNSGW